MNADPRIDRLDALLQIGQLVNHYAFALDSRDWDALAALYVEDVELYLDDVMLPGVPVVGREALKESFAKRLNRFYRTMHQICGHSIDLVDADHATGRVYTRAEHEKGDEWIDMAFVYFDDYERRDETWFFTRRMSHHLHVTSLSDRPRAPFSAPSWAPGRQAIPSAWGETWTANWAGMDDEEIASLTRDPVR
jgi:ketosteroid isomerase-like protein